MVDLFLQFFILLDKTKTTTHLIANLAAQIIQQKNKRIQHANKQQYHQQIF